MKKTLIVVALTVLVLAVLVTVRPRGAGPDPSKPGEPRSADRGTEEAEGSPERTAPPGVRPEDLFSEDPERALAAAAALSPDILTLRELRKQQAILVEHPRIWHGKRSWGVGNVEIARLLLRCAEEDFVARDKEGRSDMNESHRSFLPSSTEAVVGALGRSGPKSFPELLDYLHGRAEVTGARFETAARGFLYAIAVHHAVARGEDPPPLDGFVVDAPAAGLSEAFTTLARSAWLERREEGGVRLPPTIFLLRWGRTQHPAAADVPFLVDLARNGSLDEARAWAVTALGGFRGGVGEAVVRDLAKREDEVAAAAAGVLARWGEPGRLRELVDSDSAGELAWVIRFKLFPEEVAAALPAAIEHSIGFDEGPPLPAPFFSDFEDRANWEAWWGIEITEEELVVLGRELSGCVSDPLSLLRFYQDLGSGTLRGGILDRLIEGLRTWEPGEDEDLDYLARPLAPLEVRAPEKLRDLLAHWARGSHDGLRIEALELLARLGDTRFVPEMIRLFEATADTWFEDDLRLGRVEDQRVKEYLLRATRSEDKDLRACAFAALAEHHGLPWTLCSMGQPDEQTAASIRSGDPVAAIIGDGIDINLLASIDDDRVRKLLEWYREKRSVEWGGDVVSVYWEATAGLALHGDEDARAEIRGAIEDGRTWILELADYAEALTFRGDPEMIRLWISRIDSNCCHGLLALDLLSQAFPLLDVSYDLGNMAEVKARIGRWYDRNEGRFAWSRLVDGRVAK